jgi:beta-glucanase (GH16 family)
VPDSRRWRIRAVVLAVPPCLILGACTSSTGFPPNASAPTSSRPSSQQATPTPALATEAPTVSAPATTPTPIVPTPSPTPQRLVFSDDFSGPAGAPPNPANWKYMIGGNGWGNQELECYTSVRGNSALDGLGDLVITALKQPGHVCADSHTTDYTSARLSTQGLQAFEYGTISMRAKMPVGKGAWPAFWALGADHDTAGWPQSGEIDATEVIGARPTIVHGSLHGPEASGKAYTITGAYTAPADLSLDFHVYSVTWTATEISFSVDGHEYFSVTKATVEKTGTWEFDQPFYLLLNVAVGGSWPGPPSPATSWPQQMVVDYVRVYQDG